MAQKILNGLDMVSTPINNLPDATLPQQPVTKAQFDAGLQGFKWKEPVRAASTANITLSGTQTADGVALVAGNRFLAKDQTAAAQNGIYIVASGAWARATDMDVASEFNLATVLVSEGTANGNKSWTMTTDDPIVVGTTALVWSQTGGAGASYTAGNGITFTSSVIAVDPAVVTRKSAATIGDGTATAITVTHGLATLDVQVTVREVSTGDEVKVDNRATSTTQVVLTFAVAPTTGQYRVIVQG